MCEAVAADDKTPLLVYEISRCQPLVVPCESLNEYCEYLRRALPQSMSPNPAACIELINDACERGLISVNVFESDGPDDRNARNPYLQARISVVSGRRPKLSRLAALQSGTAAQ